MIIEMISQKDPDIIFRDCPSIEKSVYGMVFLRLNDNEVIPIT